MYVLSVHGRLEDLNQYRFSINKFTAILKAAMFRTGSQTTSVKGLPFSTKGTNER
jgi:hypothetical protein